MAVCRNHVICGRGIPSTLHSNCTVKPSGVFCGFSFSMNLGANVFSSCPGSVIIKISHIMITCMTQKQMPKTYFRKQVTYQFSRSVFAGHSVCRKRHPLGIETVPSPFLMSNSCVQTTNRNYVVLEKEKVLVIFSLDSFCQFTKF